MKRILKLMKDKVEYGNHWVFAAYLALQLQEVMRWWVDNEFFFTVDADDEIGTWLYARIDDEEYMWQYRLDKEGKLARKVYAEDCKSHSYEELKVTDSPDGCEYTMVAKWLLANLPVTVALHGVTEVEDR